MEPANWAGSTKASELQETKKATITLANPSAVSDLRNMVLVMTGGFEPVQEGQRTVIGMPSVVPQNVPRGETPSGALARSIDAA
jgi:hypothetical protein